MSSENEKREFDAMLSIFLEDLQRIEKKVKDKKTRQLIVGENSLVVQSLSFLKDFNKDIKELETKKEFYVNRFLQEKKKNDELVSAIFGLFSQKYPGNYKYDFDIPQITTGYNRYLILPIFHKNGSVEVLFFPGMDGSVVQTFVDCCKAAGLNVISVRQMASSET